MDVVEPGPVRAESAGPAAGVEPDLPGVVELGPSDADAAVALWQAVGLTRPWNDAHADFTRAVCGPSSAVLGLRDAGTPAVPARAAQTGTGDGSLSHRGLSGIDPQARVAEAGTGNRPLSHPVAEAGTGNRPLSHPVAEAGTGNRPLSHVGDLVGTAMVGHDGHRGWVYYLAVSPAAQGTGLGRRLMDACERWLVSRDIPKIQFMVRTDNTGVLSFYEHLGYAHQEVVVLGRRLD